MNQECHHFQAPGNVFFGCTLKAHMPIYHSLNNTCTLGTENSDAFAQNDIPSMFSEGQDVCIKLDSNTKWMPGKIIQILPNQNYNVKLSDGCIFQRNQHHITRRLSCLKPRATSEAVDSVPVKSYNLRPRKFSKHVQRPDIPAKAAEGSDFELPDEL